MKKTGLDVSTKVFDRLEAYMDLSNSYEGEELKKAVNDICKKRQVERNIEVKPSDLLPF